VEYNDLDILLVSENEKTDEKVNEKLMDEFSLKFHVISVSRKILERLLRVCPMFRSMLYYCVSNREIMGLPERGIEKNHIKFLLMMPEDLLDIELNSRIFFDNLRRLITIERFLEKKDTDPEIANAELEKRIGKDLTRDIRNNDSIDKITVEILRRIIREKINKIKVLMK
jgi:hypothetical protein